VGAFALSAGGSETDIGPGLELIKRIPGVKFWKAGGDVITQFKSGDIWVAVAHAGWAVRTAYAGVPVKTVPAQIGSHVGMLKEGWIGVVRGSRVKEAAEFYINTVLSPEVQYQMAVKTGTVPVHPDALKRLGNVDVVKDLVILDPARIARMTKLDAAKIDMSRWNEQWNRMISR
jgi:spermidine/putrescine-binding protein